MKTHRYLIIQMVFRVIQIQKCVSSEKKKTPAACCTDETNLSFIIYIKICINQIILPKYHKHAILSIWCYREPPRHRLIWAMAAIFSSNLCFNVHFTPARRHSQRRATTAGQSSLASHCFSAPASHAKFHALPNRSSLAKYVEYV